MLSLRRYTAADAPTWDAFVATAVNATFLLQRPYMDYHADRFADHSLMAFDEQGALTALLPGCEAVEASEGKVYYSHRGLTYGGWLLQPRSGIVEVMELMQRLVEYLRQTGFQVLYYKPIPTIYQRIPAQEDEYALWRLGATIEVCNIATTLDLRAPECCAPKVEARRRRGFKRASQAGYVLEEVSELTEFWQIVTENLQQRYSACPVHSLAEIQLLRDRFPQQIRCTCAYKSTEQGRILTGGILYFETAQVVHIQYPHASALGKADGVMDLLYLSLIEHYRAQPDIRYFDFGTSNEQAGRYLNATLVAQKEGFGGRGVAYRCYRLDLSQGNSMTL
jgi:hypothetical protein